MQKGDREAEALEDARGVWLVSALYAFVELTTRRTQALVLDLLRPPPDSPDSAAMFDRIFAGMLAHIHGQIDRELKASGKMFGLLFPAGRSTQASS